MSVVLWVVLGQCLISRTHSRWSYFYDKDPYFFCNNPLFRTQEHYILHKSPGFPRSSSVPPHEISMFPRKSAIPRKRARFLCKRSLYFRRRILFFRKRTLYSAQEPYFCVLEHHVDGRALSRLQMSCVTRMNHDM